MKSRLGCIPNLPGLAKRCRFDLHLLVKECHVSLRQFQRYCKATYYETPETWLNALRLREAEELLVQGLTVKEISYDLGFRSSSHFCALFKQVNGRTPREFALAKADAARQVAVE